MQRLTRCSSNTALIDLENEGCHRRQRAHDIARVLGAIHTDGLDVDPEALAIGQRYVEKELSIGRTEKPPYLLTPQSAARSGAFVVRHQAEPIPCAIAWRRPMRFAHKTAHRTQRRRGEPLLSTENGLERKRGVGGLLC